MIIRKKRVIGSNYVVGRQGVNMNKKKSKAIARAIMVFALVFATVMTFALTSCGNSDDKAIRDEITKQLDGIKSLDDTAVNNLLGDSINSLGLSSLGIDNGDFTKAWLTGFDYSVDNITINGNSATVSLTLTCKSINDIVATYQSELTDFANSGGAANMTADEAAQKSGQMFMDAVNSTPAKTTSIDLPCTKTGNVWMLGTSNNNELGKAFIGE